MTIFFSSKLYSDFVIYSLPFTSTLWVSHLCLFIPLPSPPIFDPLVHVGSQENSPPPFEFAGIISISSTSKFVSLCVNASLGFNPLFLITSRILVIYIRLSLRDSFFSSKKKKVFSTTTIKVIIHPE